SAALWSVPPLRMKEPGVELRARLPVDTPVTFTVLPLPRVKLPRAAVPANEPPRLSVDPVTLTVPPPLVHLSVAGAPRRVSVPPALTYRPLLKDCRSSALASVTLLSPTAPATVSFAVLPVLVNVPPLKVPPDNVKPLTVAGTATALAMSVQVPRVSLRASPPL